MLFPLKSKRFSVQNLKLCDPNPVEVSWKGSQTHVNQLRAAWDILHVPMKPAIFGKPGMGKTALAVFTSTAYFNKSIYLQPCSSQMTMEDLFARPFSKFLKTKFTYLASPLLSAFVLGGTCILDEASSLSEKNWAFLSTILESRSYLRSPIDGKIIFPHKDFRFVAIISDATIPFEIPDYIYSRLSPRIYLDFPDKGNLKNILVNEETPQESELVGQLVDYMKKQQPAISIRDGKNILRYSRKFSKYESMDIAAAIRNSAKLVSNKKKDISSSTLYKIK